MHQDRQPHRGILNLSNFCIKTGNCPSLRQSRGRAAWLASVSAREGAGEGAKSSLPPPFLLPSSHPGAWQKEDASVSLFLGQGSLSPGLVLENSEKISEVRPLLTPISSRRSRVGDWYKQQGRDVSPKHPGNFRWFKFSLGLGQLNPSVSLSEGCW